MIKDSLQCVDVSCERGGRIIFQGLSLVVEAGEVLIIQGKNGSGKSSLLKVLAGLIAPAKGMVKYNNQKISDVFAYGANVAYVGHKLAIKPQMTVRENVTLWAKLYRRTELIEAALSYFDLTNRCDIACESLSAGWRQRVALARLIVSPAKIWLLDEPMTHLDDDGMGLVESLVTTRKEQGGMVVMALHGKVKAENAKIFEIK